MRLKVFGAYAKKQRNGGLCLGLVPCFLGVYFFYFRVSGVDTRSFKEGGHF